MQETWLVTGGAGFIGSNFVRLALAEEWCAKVVVFDALTYAGNLDNLQPHIDSKEPRLEFIRGDVALAADVESVFATHKPHRVFHFAAESHVDRSIQNSAPFVITNVLGTQLLVAAARQHGAARFLLISTDEVYGALPLDSTERFHEKLPYCPSSPYSASKAAADLLALAAFHTYGQDIVITNCSNNYGPYQFPEKLIPLMIMNALKGEQLPVYGDGLYVRDWIHVEDHCRAVKLCCLEGKAGETYCIGSDNEQANINVVKMILKLTGNDESLIKYVKDRPGHDRRYAIDSGKVRTQLGWKPAIKWENGLAATVRWYVENTQWLDRIRTGEFQKYYADLYGNR